MAQVQGSKGVPFSQPKTEAQVIQKAVTSSQGWVNKTVEGAELSGVSGWDGVISAAEAAGIQFLDQFINAGAKLGDSIGRGVNQFADGSVQVLGAALQGKVDRVVSNAVKTVENVPVVGFFVKPIIRELQELVDGGIGKLFGKLESVADREIGSMVSSGVKSVDRVLYGAGESAATTVRSTATNAGESLEDPVDRGLVGGGGKVQQTLNQGIQDIGNVAKGLVTNP